MTRRIGGELEIDADLLSAPRRGSGPALPKASHLWVDTGRSALYVALREVLRRGGARRAWIPAYICESVLAPLRALDFELRFYSTGDALSETCMEQVPARGEVFLFVHYFGVTNRSALEWLARCGKRDFFVVEDCVQASLAGNVGAAGDFAITSYRKFLAQPDGALLASDSPIDAQLDEADEAFVSAKLAAKLLRGSSVADSVYLDLFAEAEKRIDGDPIPRRMSWLSRFLLDRTDLAAVAESRRRNWQSLGRRLAASDASSAIAPLFTDFEQGDVPLGFPVKVAAGGRDALRRHLAAKRVYCPVHWELPHLDAARFPVEAALSRSILTLPIDQRLDEEAIAYMVRSIEAFHSESRAHA